MGSAPVVDEAGGHGARKGFVATSPARFLGRPATQGDLEPHVQLVLSDPLDAAGANYGLVSAKLWRFVNLARRLDFLIAGFGGCRMPEHLIHEHVAAGSLVLLPSHEDPTPRDGLTMHTAHRRDRALGPAGRWLLGTLRRCLCP